MIRKSGCADPLDSGFPEEDFAINTSRRRNYNTSTVTRDRESGSILKNPKLASNGNKRQTTLSSIDKISKLEILSGGQQTPIFEDRENFSIIEGKSGFVNRDASNVTGVGI